MMTRLSINPLSDLDRTFALFQHGFGRERVAYPRDKHSFREEQDAFFIELEVPGYSERDLNISLEKGEVHVHGEVRKPSDADGASKVVRKFQRAFQLPYEIDAQASEAKAKDGLLTLKLAKTSASKPTKISVQAG
jgi:HSP20 family protein